MAFNVRPGGNAESVPVVEAVNSGDVVRIGNFVGVAQIDAEEARDVPGTFYTTLALEGIANAQVAGALTVGQAVYTSTAAPTGSNPGVVATLTATATGNKLVGFATRAKATGTSMAWFKLVQTATVGA